MSHANPGSWTDLAVVVPTIYVEYRAKVVFCIGNILMEEAIINVQGKSHITVVTWYPRWPAKESGDALVDTKGSRK